MARPRKLNDDDLIDTAADAGEEDLNVLDGEGGSDELIPQDTLICALTGQLKIDKPEERVLQSLIEQLHREYRVELSDMERDVRVACRDGAEKKKTVSIGVAVYEGGKSHTLDNLIRVVLVAKSSAKASDAAIGQLELVLSNLNEARSEVYGVWTNGKEMAFRMRTYDIANGFPLITELTDFPAPDETLADLDDADRRALRVAAGDLLLRAFNHCHDYLSTHGLRDEKAFWQLLYLIFAKIVDEQQSKRLFFVGATERNTPEGQARIAKRIHALFDTVKGQVKDVFDGYERLEPNDRSLAYVAAQLARFDLLSADTDAKGMAFEAITSHTLKQKKGQFFTPRNVIQMMVEMIDPQPGKRVLDPACGSGGFLIVALNHARRRILTEIGCPAPDDPVPSERKRADPLAKRYARENLYGFDVDGDLRKAARMNMVMNGDGHGHIFNFNSLEYGVYGEKESVANTRYRTPEMAVVERTLGVGAGEAHGQFDYVFTNPPFGAKIPVEDPEVLRHYELGYTWRRDGERWVRHALQKKVAPEVLFIEACWKFLKPGTGVMALILPNGILGNPGEQMEFVRHWLLQNGELLASVDLPAETFLPQVSVQASCLFVRRRALDEIRMVGRRGPKQRPVFMAIAENCGHGRRGEPRYVREPDGSESLFELEVPDRWERDGRIHERMRLRKGKRLADDLPLIAAEYRRIVSRGRLA
ncbi:HsdM family class I SAM-dependent methyltransferase [Bradyrhizobium sp. BR 1433]|uniref:HsdM family class I SAM-dependent methyltransferase n=1 Tax=Bradyrhizobium sp. BR 1433 TaxID=3447967 RepID=UPI003EE70C8B